MGEGGAATTTDEELDHRLKLFRNHGIYREENPEPPWFYQMHHLGFNYRASDIHCALGISQLNKLAQFSRKRRLLVELYDIFLKPFGSVVRPVKRMPGQPVWHLYLVLIDFCENDHQPNQIMKRNNNQYRTFCFYELSHQIMVSGGVPPPRNHYLMEWFRGD